MSNTTHDQYIRDLEDNYGAGIATIHLKSQDYARPDDPFWNFRFSAQVQGTSVQRAILGRFAEKLGRFLVLLDREEKGEGGPEVKDETADDTLLDMMNTINILHVARQWQRKYVDGYAYAGAPEDYQAEDEEEVIFIPEEPTPDAEPEPEGVSPEPPVMPAGPIEAAREKLRRFLLK